jgi:DNA-binding transcriptional LysR family regulator
MYAFGSKMSGFEYFDGEKYRQVKMKGIVAVNSVMSYGDACFAGLGIAQLPLIGTRKHLKDGSLIEVLPKNRAQPYKMKLVYHERRLLSQRVRVFMDWLEKILKDCLC